MTTPNHGNNVLNACWIAVIAATIFVLITSVPEQIGEQAISDKGIFSYLTIILLSVSLAFVIKACALNVYPNYRFSLWLLAYCLIIYVLREADFHRLFTDEHITKTKFFKNPDISLQQKLIGGTPLILFFIAAIVLIFKYTRLIIRSLLRATPWAVATFMWGATFVTSQLFDKSDLNEIYPGRATEELLEVCASGYVLLAVLQSLRPAIAALQARDS